MHPRCLRQRDGPVGGEPADQQEIAEAEQKIEETKEETVTEEKIEEVKQAVEEIVEEYVALRRAGAGSLKGLCPFHDEKSPSFTVRPSHGTFHCFGCGQHGSVIDFVMKMEVIGFPEAVERLAERCGVRLTYEGGTSRIFFFPESSPCSGNKGRLLLVENMPRVDPLPIPQHTAASATTS